MIGVDKTGPGPATQVLPPTILIYAGTISGRAMIAWDILIVMASIVDLVKDVLEEQNIVTTLCILSMILNLTIGMMYLPVKTNQTEYTRLTPDVQ